MFAETLSEAVKMLKGEYCVQAINEHKMDRALIFCRTKIDCDNLERYLISVGESDIPFAPMGMAEQLMSGVAMQE